MASEKAPITGTLPFIATDILGLKASHAPAHDLESFFWVLTWICLKYEGPNGARVNLSAENRESPRMAALEGMTKATTWLKAARQKGGLLLDMSAADFGPGAFHPYFKPLFKCMTSLARIFLKGLLAHQEVERDEGSKIDDRRTHKDVIGILTEAYNSIPPDQPDNISKVIDNAKEAGTSGVPRVGEVQVKMEYLSLEDVKGSSGPPGRKSKSERETENPRRSVRLADIAAQKATQRK